MSSGGTAIVFKVGNATASSAHTTYISRERAVYVSRGGKAPGGGGRSVAAEKQAGRARIKYIGRDGAGPGGARPGFVLHNMPQEIEGAGSYDQMRRELASWAAHRAEVEVKRHGERAGQARTHYRSVMSYEKKVSNETALEGAQAWLDECFPTARAAVFVHQDTDHTHVHVWIDARKLDGSKIHLGHKTHRSLDEKWNRIYCRQMGRDVGEHLRKKAEAKAIKGALHKGWHVPRRPERVTPSGPAVYEARDRRFEQQEAKARGGLSFAARVRERAEGDFQEAKSLEELNERLAPKGLKVVSKGRGGVVRTLDETEEAKLSAVGRAFSWGKLHAAFEKRRAEAERQRAMGASLARDLRRRRTEGAQRGVRAKEATAAPLGLRIRAVRIAGEELQRVVARRREERRQSQQGEEPGGAEEATAETLLPPKVMGVIETGAKQLSKEDRAQAVAEPADERPAEEETGADWVDDVLAGSSFPSHALGKESSENEERPREGAPEPPAEAASAPENKASPAGRGRGRVLREPLSGASREAEEGRGADADHEGTVSPTPEDGGATSKPRAGDEKQAATQEAASTPDFVEAKSDAATGRGAAEAETDEQDAPEKEGDPELEAQIALGERLSGLLTQVAEERQREDTQRQVLAELEERARRMEQAFAERTSMLIYETVRRQLAKEERDLLDACKEMREQQRAEAVRPAKANQAAPTPESKAEAGRDEQAISERDRPGAAEKDEAAADDVARQLVARDFDRGRSVDAGKSAGTAAPTEVGKEGVSRGEAEKAASEERREAREADAAPKKQLRWLLRQIRQTRGRVQKKRWQEARGLVREMMYNVPGPERQRFTDSLPDKSKAVLNKIAQAVRAAQDRSSREGSRKATAAKQKTRDRKTGGESRRADAKADRRSEAAPAVEEKLKAALHALLVLDERVEKARKAKTPEAKKKAGSAVKQAREHYGTEPAVQKKIIRLAGRFADRSTDAERDAFEAGLSDQISQRRFRTAVQMSKTTKKQQDSPENEAGQDTDKDFEVG